MFSGNIFHLSGTYKIYQMKIRVDHLEEMPSQGGLGGLTLCLNPQEQQAVKILMIFAVFGSFKQTNC